MPKVDSRDVISIVLGLAILWLGQMSTAWACSCIKKVSCGPHHYLDVDFIGEVLSRQIVSSDGSSDGTASSYMLRPQSNLFQVRVLESFRGGQNVGEIVRVKTGMGGGDCGYRFKIGEKYLIDASKNIDVLLTGICSLTAPVEQSQVELRALRDIAAGRRIPDLTGVLMNAATASNNDYRTVPVSGIPVTLKRISSGTSLTAVSDGFGAFTFSNALEGEYGITLDLPNNLSPTASDFGFIVDDQIPPLSIENKDGGTAGCHILIVVDVSGSVAGVVKAVNGQPIDGWVNVDTVTPDGRPRDTVLSTVPAPDGVFRLAHLMAGHYQVQFIRRAGFVQGEPQIIDLKDGEHKTGLVLIAR
jgi:hypothetical protein